MSKFVFGTKHVCDACGFVKERNKSVKPDTARDGWSSSFQKKVSQSHSVPIVWGVDHVRRSGLWFKLLSSRTSFLLEHEFLDTSDS